jgi:hypothetical protein
MIAIKTMSKADHDRDTVEIVTEEGTYSVQTVDGEFRPALGCLIFLDQGSGQEEVDHTKLDDLDMIIRAAEDYSEEDMDDDLTANPEYFNKDQSPYTPRYLKEASE